MNKIRLGIIGANSTRGWAARAHLPAIAASSQFELTAVCTTRQETADETARRYGARYAFHDYRAMLETPEIDAVSVVLRVPAHFEPTRDAINAGKAVFTEWPLARTTSEAVELAELAKSARTQTAVGLQLRAHPVFRYVKDCISKGLIGEPLSCRTTLVRVGQLDRHTEEMWQRDAAAGANSLTISNGHVVDVVRFLLGEFKTVASLVRTQFTHWHDLDTGELLEVDAPDSVIVGAELTSGVLVSSHVATVPTQQSEFHMDINGREGVFKISGANLPQLVPLTLKMGKAGSPLATLVPPQHYYGSTGSQLSAEPFGIAELYDEFAASLRGGELGHPDFDTAVALHRLIDAIKESSDARREVTVASPQ